MAHACTHCQKYILVQPRLNKDEFWECVLEVDLLSVNVAASNGCAFFNWCLSQHPEASNPTRLHELGDKVVLRASMWAGARSNSSTGQFVSLCWVTEPPVAGMSLNHYIRGLYLMAEVGEHRLFQMFLNDTDLDHRRACSVLLLGATYL